MQAELHSSKNNKEQWKQKAGRSIPQLKRHLLFIQFVLNIKHAPIKFSLNSQSQNEPTWLIPHL